MRYGEVKAPLCSHRVDQAPAIRIDTALAGRHTYTHTHTQCFAAMGVKLEVATDKK